MKIFPFLALYSSIGVFILFNSASSIKIAIIFVLGTLTYLLADKLIPLVEKFMMKNDIYGYDINKKGSPRGQIKIPECVGFASAVAFIIVAMVTSLLIKLSHQFYDKTSTYEQIHLSYLVTILGTVLLGFADDMLDLPWRYKLILPFFIVIPALCNYTGPTSIQLPYPLNQIMSQIQLGPLFLLYITLLGIYCTNTINIYAGINGLEVGQSIVAAASLLILLSISSYKTGQIYQNQYYSIFLLVTFLAASLALLKKNAYPSQVFIGDTYCYFAGIVLCLVAVNSHHGINIHWLLFPQLINFLYSCPQLFGFYPCPRHRLTTYLKDTDKLQAIKQNMNLLNLSLRVIGPTNQGQLCKKLIYFQIITSSIPIIYQIFI